MKGIRIEHNKWIKWRKWKYKMKRNKNNIEYKLINTKV